MKCCRCWVLGVPPTWLVLCGLVMVQVGFGLYPVVVKEFASTAEPLVIVLYQNVGCFPVMFLCAVIMERKLMFPGLKMLLVFLFLGLCGMFSSHLLYMLGVYWAGPNPATAIQQIIPVWTAILAVVTCTEKLPSPLHVHTWVKLLGIVMATGGAVELILTANSAKSSVNSTHTDSNSTTSSPVTLRLLGYFALLGNTICIAVYLLVQKRFIFNSPENKWREHPIYVTAYTYMFGALFVALASTYFLASGKRDRLVITGTSVYAVLYAVFISSATSSLLLTWTNMHLSATVITAFWPLQVLVSVGASYFATKDDLAPYQYIGAVMLIGALFLVLFSNHMEERLQDGKPVLRVDCHMTDNTVTHETAPENEKSSLLPRSQLQPQQSGVIQN